MHPNNPPLPFESLVVYLYVEVPVSLSYSELTVIVTGDETHGTTASPSLGISGPSLTPFPSPFPGSCSASGKSGVSG